MSVFEYVIGALLLVVSIVLTVIILAQKDRASTSANAFQADASDSFFSKNSGRSKEATLSRITKILSVAMFVLAIAINIYINVTNNSDDTASETSSVASVSDTSAISSIATSVESSITTSAASSVESSVTSSVEASVESSVGTDSAVSAASQG